MNLTCLLPLAWCQQSYSNLCNTRICPFLLIKAFDQNQWHGRRQPYLIWAGELGLLFEHHKKKGGIYIWLLAYSFLSSFIKVTVRSFSSTVKLVWNLTEDQHFLLPFPLSSLLKNQHFEIFQIFISCFSACDSLVLWSCSPQPSIQFTLESERKNSVSEATWQKAHIAEHHCHVAWPASHREQQSLPHTTILERVEPTNELTEQSCSWGCILKKGMHKFTHSETWSV